MTSQGDKIHHSLTKSFKLTPSPSSSPIKLITDVSDHSSFFQSLTKTASPSSSAALDRCTELAFSSIPWEGETDLKEKRKWEKVGRRENVLSKESHPGNERVENLSAGLSDGTNRICLLNTTEISACYRTSTDQQSNPTTSNIYFFFFFPRNF